MNGVKTHLSLSERFKFKYFCANDNNNAHLEYMTMISHDWLAKVCVCECVCDVIPAFRDSVVDVSFSFSFRHPLLERVPM